MRQSLDELVFHKGKVYTKNYERNGAKARSLLADERFGVTRTGRAEAEAALGHSGVFDFPKPVRLIQHLVRIADDSSAVVLDFFAGSGTTAHAVMAQNAKDGGARRFIQVQLPEPTPEDSEARAVGYKLISEISRARIAGAGAKLQVDLTAQLAAMGPPLDVGFRAYRLADTNFSKWRVGSDVEEDALQQRLIELRESSSADDATADDLLLEILLKQGYSLTEKIAPVDLEGLKLLAVLQSDGDIAVLAHVNEHVKPTLDQLRAMVDADPQRIIVLEDAFQGDDELKTNLVQLVKSRGTGKDTDMQLWTA